MVLLVEIRLRKSSDTWPRAVYLRRSPSLIAKYTWTATSSISSTLPTGTLIYILTNFLRIIFFKIYFVIFCHFASVRIVVCVVTDFTETDTQRMARFLLSMLVAYLFYRVDHVVSLFHVRQCFSPHYLLLSTDCLPFSFLRYVTSFDQLHSYSHPFSLDVRHPPLFTSRVHIHLHLLFHCQPLFLDVRTSTRLRLLLRLYKSHLSRDSEYGDCLTSASAMMAD